MNQGKCQHNKTKKYLWCRRKTCVTFRRNSFIVWQKLLCGTTGIGLRCRMNCSIAMQTSLWGPVSSCGTAKEFNGTVRLTRPRECLHLIAENPCDAAKEFLQPCKGIPSSPSRNSLFGNHYVCLYKGHKFLRSAKGILLKP